MKSCTRCGAAFEAEGDICPHCQRELDQAKRYGSEVFASDLPPAPSPPPSASGPVSMASQGSTATADPQAPASGADDDADEDEDDAEEGQTRRRFLTNTALTVGGVVGVGYLGLALRYLFPNVSAAATGLQDVGPVTKFASDAPTLATILQDGVKDGVYVVNLAKSGTPTDKQLVALDIHCTHLNCPVTWYPGVAGIGRYICPCHGSQFTITGKHVAGPAPRPMYQHQIVLKNGRVLVGGIIS